MIQRLAGLPGCPRALSHDGYDTRAVRADGASGHEPTVRASAIIEIIDLAVTFGPAVRLEPPQQSVIGAIEVVDACTAMLLTPSGFPQPV